VRSGAPIGLFREGGALPERWRSVEAVVRVGCGCDRRWGRRVVVGGDDGVALQHRGVKGEAKNV
jgi:hypothetical protein